MYWKTVKHESFFSQVSELLILGNWLFLCEELLFTSAFVYVFSILGANAVKFLDGSAHFKREVDFALICKLDSHFVSYKGCFKKMDPTCYNY